LYIPQHLSISTIGQDDITDPAYNQIREERRYDELAAFIASTRDALETPVFEQGILRRRSQEAPNTGIDRRTFHHVGRPMDTYFLQHIFLPVICSTEWKKLKRVVIRWETENDGLEFSSSFWLQDLGTRKLYNF
jgi:hypothetical protein